MSFKSLYSVENVPIYLRAPFWLYGYGVGVILNAYISLIHWTSKVEHVNRDSMDGEPNFILCVWHDAIWACFGVFGRFPRHIWLNHPHWYMKPIHVLLHMRGVERLIYGSTGNNGKKAAEELGRCLMQGYSTLIIPDGPYGPAHVLKKGVLHLSLQTKLKIVPLKFECSRSIRLRDWDRKILPLPFGKIRVFYGAPLLVCEGKLEEAAVAVSTGLGQ